jgi:fibronectin type 3 domain-containing protein
MIRSFLRKAQMTTKGGCLATGAPNQPGGLTATGGVGTISLSWTADATAAPNQASYYEVERSNDGLGSWSVIATSLGTNSYTDTVAASTSRHYRVYAYNCDSGSLASTSASAKTAPAAPSSLTATATSSTQINLAWTDNSSDETGFIIQQRSPSGSGSWSTIHTTGAGATSYSVTGLTASTNYGFRVAATRTSPSGTSDYTAEASATTQSGTSTYSVEYLCIAGGGGGGGGAGGSGGGAGGYRTATGFSLTVGQSYTVTVGAGGASATSGNNSVFDTITSTGGGRGGTYLGAAAANGGSGGGAGGASGTVQTPGTGTSGQGNDGGANQTSGPFGCGGGGGAGAVGGAPAGNTSGAGGAGTASSITGTSVTRAGGGGGGAHTSPGTGGAGGAGGGAAGGAVGGNGSAASANTGGGGGGNNTGNGGGSGVVILRIPAANYSGTTTGSPTVTDDGSFKVLVYNSSGSYTG